MRGRKEAAWRRRNRVMVVSPQEGKEPERHRSASQPSIVDHGAGKSKRNKNYFGDYRRRRCEAVVRHQSHKKENGEGKRESQPFVRPQVFARHFPIKNFASGGSPS